MYSLIPCLRRRRHSYSRRHSRQIHATFDLQAYLIFEVPCFGQSLASSFPTNMFYRDAPDLLLAYLPMNSNVTRYGEPSSPASRMAASSCAWHLMQNQRTANLSSGAYEKWWPSMRWADEPQRGQDSGRVSLPLFTALSAAARAYTLSRCSLRRRRLYCRLYSILRSDRASLRSLSRHSSMCPLR